MKHRPIKSRYFTICELCRKTLSYVGGYWTAVDSGEAICRGEYGEGGE